MKGWRPLKLEELSTDSQHLYDVLNDGTDLACVLIGTSYLAELMATVLKEHFIASSIVEKLLDPQRGALGGFATRCDLAYCLNLITKPIYNDLIIVAQIRNQFAHKHLALDFADASVRELCAKLTTWRILLKGADDTLPGDVTPEEQRILARNQFKISVVLMTTRIHVDALSRQRAQS